MIQEIELTDLSAPEMDIYARLRENELRHYYEPNGGLFLAETAMVIGRALDAGCVPVSALVEKRQLASYTEVLSRCGQIPVYTAPLSVMEQLTGYTLTRGILCAMRRPPALDAYEICRGANRVAVLECMMNPTNLGAVFRSAAALGIDAVLLSPGCCDPLFRRCIRVSMGTVFQVPWAFLSDWPDGGLAMLHALGFSAVAMALKDPCISVDDPCLKQAKKLTIVLGTEGEGLADETIALCDHTARIPMANGVDSLNAAAAGAVAFWELGKR